MKRALISWIAKNNDFSVDGNINAKGPNTSLHEHYYNHESHILLSSSPEGDTRDEHFAAYLRKRFPSHRIELRSIPIDDPVDFKEVLEKVQEFLTGYRDIPLDIFFSPGTSIMQVVWYIVQVSGAYDSRIIQGRPEKFTGEREPRFWETRFIASDIPRNILISDSPSTPAQGLIDIPELKDVYGKAGLVAAAERVPVLITGESGTGKELLARHVWQQSARRNSRFVAINCASLRDELLESRLFGYQKGAFTGANSDRKGLFEEYDGGTVFLDEIGDISLYMQQTLLRVIQNGEILPVGSLNARKVNVRLIFATHRNLPEQCESGKFRWDLYYRINVAGLSLPPLRHWCTSSRMRMFNHILDAKAGNFGRQIPEINEEALQRIQSYPYPGNIRQMENLADFLLIYGQNKISYPDLPVWITHTGPDTFGGTLDDCIRKYTREVYERSNGNTTLAARKLGISVNTLKKYLNPA
jgi:sigma54-dependent transcription regulator